MDLPSLQAYQRSLLNQALAQGLIRNEEQTKTWAKYKTEHEKVIKGLEVLPLELTINCMVPIGKKALMKGKLAHTNEILVCLGEGYFAKYSARQAIALCNRRIKQAEVMLENLSKERDLLEMRQIMSMDLDIFGDGEVRDIIEPCYEESKKGKRIQHKPVDENYHQKLAELRAQKEFHNDEDEFRRLEELELQEELEEEIERLREEQSNYYGEDLGDGEAYYESEDDESSEEETTADILKCELAKLSQKRTPYNLGESKESENTENKSSSNENNQRIDEETPVSNFEMNKQMDGSEHDSLPETSGFCSAKNSSNENSAEKIIKDQMKMPENGDSSCGSMISSSNSSEIESVDSVSLRTSIPGKSHEPGFLQGISEGLSFKENPKVTERRVSFVDLLPVQNAMASSSANELESGNEKPIFSERRVSFIGETYSSDVENLEGVDETDEDEVIRISFRHSENSTKIPIGEGRTIENPSDIYRVFCKPKSILKRSPDDMSYFQKVVPAPDDSTDEEFVESEPGGSAYTIVVKDIQERKPEVPEVPTSEKRPVSRFKMARSGMKR